MVCFTDTNERAMSERKCPQCSGLGPSKFRIGRLALAR